MKSPSLKTRRILSGSAFAFFAIVVGQVVASLGLGNPIESAFLPADAVIVAAAMPKSGKSVGAKVDGDMVTLSFDEPTNIKAMAEVSGRNIILPSNIDGKI